jgi:hypothetical protein
MASNIRLPAIEISWQEYVSIMKQEKVNHFRLNEIERLNGRLGVQHERELREVHDVIWDSQLDSIIKYCKFINNFLISLQGTTRNSPSSAILFHPSFTT